MCVGWSGVARTCWSGGLYWFDGVGLAGLADRMTTAPDGRSLIGDVVRLDRLVAADIDSLYAAIGNEQVYAGGFAGGTAGMPADVEQMREQWVESSAQRVAYVVKLAGG